MSHDVAMVLRPRTLAWLLATTLVSAAARAQDRPASIEPPQPVERVEPEYPPSLSDGRHGDVVLLVVVDEEGHVADVTVAESAGPLMDGAANRAVRAWRFTPARRDGKAVRSRVRVAMHFAPPAPAAPTATLDPAPPQAPPAEDHHDTHRESDPVDDVTVHGRLASPSRGASDFRIDVGDLSRVPRANASQLLTLAPGVLLMNEGGDGHAEQVFMRGFDAREGQDIEFSVGGVPINESGNLHANGYADTHFIIPELVESVRVLEGPFDPRQGNYAVAGSVDYRLGLVERGITAKAQAGSFGTKRLVLLWGPRGMQHGTFGGVELFSTEGYGQNRSADRASAMGQYEGSIGSHGTYRIATTAYTNDYRSAGVLRADDEASGRKRFFDTYDFGLGGQSSRYSLSADVESKKGRTTYGQQLFVIARGMRVAENFTGFLLDVQQPTQSPHGQRGDRIDRSVTEQTFGARGFARTRLDALRRAHDVEVGYFARYDDVSSRQSRIQASNDVPYTTDVDLGSRLVDVGLYGDANARILPWLSARGGARADLFSFDIDNRCASREVRRPSPANPPGDSSCLSQQDFGRYREPYQRATTASAAFMPRATLVAGSFAGFTFHGAYGQGVRSVDPIYVYDDTKTPFARVEAYEGGAAYLGELRRGILRGSALDVRSTFFQTHVDRDLVFSQTEGRNTLANGTTRTGWAGSMRLRGDHLDHAASVTLVRSSFDDTGLLVPYVPDVVVRDDLVLKSKLGVSVDGSPLEGSLGTGVTFVGRRALPFGERSGVLFTVDTSATISWKAVEIGLVVQNLLDRRQRLNEYNYASDWGSAAQPTLVPARHFVAAPPRVVLGQLTLRFEGP